MEKETIITGITIILLIISFSAYACMGTLLFHYPKSIFSSFENQQYFNPALSSNNKWRNRNKEEGELFPFSSTALVFLTDCYHGIQFMFENSLFLAFSVYNTNHKIYLTFIGIRLIYSLVFNMMFDKVLVRK